MFPLFRSRAPLGRAPLTVVLTILAFAAGGCSRAATKPASSISAPDREVLTQYEAMRAALADDDLRKARLVGEKLLKAIDEPGVSAGLTKSRNAAKIMSEASRIDLMRSAFKDLSGSAVVPLCQGVEGYFVFSTDLIADGAWVQTTTVAGNPYLGRSMALYGEIKK